MPVRESIRLQMGFDGLSEKGRREIDISPPSYYCIEYGEEGGEEEETEGDIGSTPPPPLPTVPPPPLERLNRGRMRLTPSPKNPEESSEGKKKSDQVSHQFGYHRPIRLNDTRVMNSPPPFPPSPPTSLFSSSSSFLLSSPSSSHPHPLPSYDQVTMRKQSDPSIPRFSRSTIRQASFKAAINNQLSQSSSSTPSCVSPSGLHSLPSFSSSIPTSFSTSITLNSLNSPESIDPSPPSSFSSSSSNSIVVPSKSKSIESRESMRRARPKSYVLATSCSFPVTGGISPPPTIRNDRGSSSGLIDIDSASSSREESKEEGNKHNSVSSSHLHPSSGVEDHSKTQRLHRIFALFSHNNENRKSSPSREEKKEDKKERRKRSRTTVVTSRVPLHPPSLSHSPLSIRCDETVKQGALLHQELALGISIDSKRLTRLSQWNQCWAVLTYNRLFLCSQLSSYHSDLTGERMLSIPCEARVLNLEGALADIAYEYSRVKEEQRFIVRVVTHERSEHLLQCAKESEMLEWINRIQEASATTSNHSIHSDLRSSLSSVVSPSSSSSKEGEGRSANLLIMHRYKAKSTALGSPLSSKRSSQDVGVAPTTNSSRTEANGEGVPSGGTPRTVRRWKKGKEKDSKKHMSMTEPGPSNLSPGSFAIGVKLANCPTRGDNDMVPLIVRACTEAVEKNGMDSVGIYRIPGNTAAVNALKEWTNIGGIEVCNINDPRWKDVNVVSSFLKLFLRNLPEPLLTDKLYPFFIDANRINSHSQRLHKIRNLLRKLPREHYECLKFLVMHLYEVAQHSEFNRMEMRNVSLMFGPSIVRPSDDSMATMVTHMSDQCRIVETFLQYREWMFNDEGTSDDAVPIESIADKEIREAPRGSGMDSAPPGVSTASFNDMHSMIIRANEKQAEDMMKENDKGKIKNILNVRRSSKRDKSKSKKGVSDPIPSTSSGPSYPSSSSSQSKKNLKSNRTETSVDSAFSGNYQERDIDAEIASRSKCSSEESTRMGSADRKEDEDDFDEVMSIKEEFSQLSMQSNQSDLPPTNTEDRRKHQETLSSARRIFIAGSEAAAIDSLSSSHSQTSATMDALTNHTQHLHQAASPALEVYSAETREKIRRMQLLGTSAWRNVEKPCSPSREDAISFTSDYSTTSSLAPSQSIGVVVTSFDGLGPTSSDYASSDPSPCGRRTREEKDENGRLNRPDNLRIGGERNEGEEKGRRRDGRRHTLSGSEDEQIPQSAKWELSRGRSYPSIDNRIVSPPPILPCLPPSIIRTSPNEMTPASGDEQL